MSFRFFTLGETDYQNSLVDQTSIHLTSKIENFTITPTRSLRPRPEFSLVNQYAFPEGEIFLREATFIRADVRCYFTNVSGLLVIYYFDNNVLISRIETGVSIIGTVRTLYLSKENRYAGTPSAGLKQFGGLLVFGLTVLEYFPFSAVPTFSPFPITTPDGIRYLVSPVDGTYLQERLWLIGDSLVTSPTTPTILGESILVASDASIMNSTKLSSTVRAKDGFVSPLAVQFDEDITTITGSQTSLFITTTRGLMNIRADDSNVEAITANSAIQFFAGSLATRATKPVVLLSRFLVYATGTGVYYKDVGNFESAGKSVPDIPMNTYRSLEAPVEALFLSNRIPVVYYLTGNELKAISISASETPPNGVGVTTFMKLGPSIQQSIQTYAPFEGILITLDGTANIIREYVEDESLDATAPTIFDRHRLKYILPISRNSPERSMWLEVYIKVSLPTPDEMVDFFEVEASSGEGISLDTSPSRGVLDRRIGDILMYRTELIVEGEKGTMMDIDISITPLPPILITDFEVLFVRL